MFKTCDDIRRWLEPMSYDAFWDEIAPYGLALPLREECDAQIACGEVAEAVVLSVLKNLARIELQAIFGLGWESTTTRTALH